MTGTIFTLRNLYRDGTICLEKAGIADAKLDAWYLLEYETKISRAMFLADPDKEVEKDKAEHYRKDIETRAQRIPLQHITGEQELTWMQERNFIRNMKEYVFLYLKRCCGSLPVR